MNSATLHSVFSPKSVAVVGASSSAHSIGAEIFHNLLNCHFTGPVFPVNPHRSVVQSVRAYTSVLEIPDEVELVVIVIPAEAVLDCVEQCIEKRVKAIVVISAGFSETGPEGKRRQAQLVARCRSQGIRIVGPNCLGLLNTDPAISLNATFAPTWPPSGSVSFASQSGALGLAILDYAKELGIGIRHFISVGNKADISGNDLLAFWGDDEATKVVLLYLESIGNPKRFMAIARAMTRKKPVLMVKSGRTESGARAATSHTGALVGLDIAVDALLGQVGVVRTNTIEDLFDLAMLLANQPVPRGDRIAIISNAGGPAIMASDACESCGLKMAQLSDETKRELRLFLPAEASVENPIDMIASASANSYERSLMHVLADPGVDAVLVLFVPPIVTEASEVAEAIERACANTTKTVLTCFMGSHGIPAALTSLRKARFPSYTFPESAIHALAKAVNYGLWLRQPEGKFVEFSDIDRDAIPVVLRNAPTQPVSNSRWLGPLEAMSLLSAYGIETPPFRVVHTVEEAISAAQSLGYPVALKLISSTIQHKSDVGGVHLHLHDAHAVKTAFERLETHRAKASPASDEGVLIQKMMPTGVEILIGMTLDPAFGPLIGLGLGGIHVELLRDVVFRVHPITDVDAAQMVSQLRGARLLDGFRGAPPADRDAIVKALLRVNAMLSDLPQMIEMDLNPLIVYPPMQGLIAVDAKIRIS